MDDKKLQRYMNVPEGSRLWAFIASAVLMAVVAMVIEAVLLHAGITTPKLRIATVVQDLLMFVLPPIITAVIACRLPARFLLLDKPRSAMAFVAMISVTVVSIPMMNCIVALNESMTLPEGLSALEEWMRQSENSAQEAVKMMMGGSTVADLVMDVLIVGVLAGFSEELFFRGGLQQVLITGRLKPHAAIWITAFVFSAIHLQFYGFIPRLLLGAWFGYLAWWSGTIWLPVTAHVLNNTIVVVSTWLLDRGAISTSVDEFGASLHDDIAAVAASAVATVIAIIWVWRACRISRERKEVAA